MTSREPESIHPDWAGIPKVEKWLGAFELWPHEIVFHRHDRFRQIYDDAGQHIGGELVLGCGKKEPKNLVPRYHAEKIGRPCRRCWP